MWWWQGIIRGSSPPSPGLGDFPLEFDLIPSQLSLKVHAGSYGFEDGTFQFWAYSTSGLSRLGQQELVLILRKEHGAELGSFPQAPIELFKSIYSYAHDRQYATVGTVSEFGENGFLAQRFKGMGYIEAKRLGEFHPPTNSLCLVLLTANELKAAHLGGLSRITAMLGKRFSFYPCPHWNDLKRADSVEDDELEEMTGSPLAMLPRMILPSASALMSDDLLEFRLNLGQRHLFQQFDDFAPEQPLAVITGFDQRANACLTWQKEKPDTALALTPPGSDGSLTMGSFICFIPASPKNYVAIIEDGFYLSLKNPDWEKLKTSLKEGAPLEIEPDQGDYRFRLVFADSAATSMTETLDCNPPTNDFSAVSAATESNGFPGNLPPSDLISGELVPAYAREFQVITHEAELNELIEPKILSGYMHHLEDIIHDFFAQMGEDEGRDLTVSCTLLPESKMNFAVSADPNLEPEDEQCLVDRLELSYPPKIKSGQVKFKIALVVWGGKFSEK